MSRTIKFRAWDKVKQEMFLDPQVNTTVTVESGIPIRLVFQDPDKIFMQWTGLHDKNGKEIYEGDICRLINKEQYKDDVFMSGIRTVEWNDRNMYLEFSGFIPLKWNGHESIEVIGDIYRNPELIQQ